MPPPARKMRDGLLFFGDPANDARPVTWRTNVVAPMLFAAVRNAALATVHRYCVMSRRARQSASTRPVECSPPGQRIAVSDVPVETNRDSAEGV